MIATASMLLVGHEQPARELQDQFGDDILAWQGDPYQALVDLSRQPWKAVILEAPCAELAELARACRRLQPSSKVFVLCPPAGEAQARELLGETIDDYLIAPPTEREIETLRRLAAGEGPAEPSPGESLPPWIVARLMAAASSIPALESALAAIVGGLVGAEAASWTDHDPSQAAQEGLLTIAPSRILIAQGPKAPGPEARATLDAIQAILPSLADNARRMESLHRLAVTDHLTGAFNRRYFYHVTDQILSHAQGPAERIKLLLYDIDDFKHYNETYGYAVGDEILRQTALLMKTICRAQDVVARIGGDEFAVLFWDRQGPRSADSQPIQTAADLAERFRHAVNTQAFSVLGPHAVGALSISGGLASFPRDGRDVRELLRSADKALKTIKRSGKNAIQIIG